MVCMGGNVTVLLDLGLHHLVRICHLTKEPWGFHWVTCHVLDRDQWALAEKEHLQMTKPCVRMCH